MTVLGSSSSNSLTIWSTDTASLSCRWLVKSRIFRQALRQSCRVIKCLLVAIWSNIWCCWRFPRSALISVVNGYILNITKYQTHTFKSHLLTYHPWFSPVLLLVQISPGFPFGQTEAVGGTCTLPVQVFGLLECKCMSLLPFRLIGSVSCQTVIFQFSWPFDWFSLLFVFLGSLLSRAAPSRQHVYRRLLIKFCIDTRLT